jgi:hypothetical protein
MKYAVAPLCLLLAAGAARADLVAWNYDWSKSSPGVPVGVDTGVVFTPSAGIATGDHTIRAVTLSAIIFPVRAAPQDVSGRPYSLVLDLTDKASGQTGEVTFTGQLFGPFGDTNVFNAPRTQHLHLGGHDYAVTLVAYTAPGPPLSHLTGSIVAGVTIDAADTAPEPTGFALAAAGLSLAGGLSWVRRRRSV